MHTHAHTHTCTRARTGTSRNALERHTDAVVRFSLQVFKKQNSASLWVLAAGDIIERFQFFVDALFVYLQALSSLRYDATQAVVSLRWLVSSAGV